MGAVFAVAGHRFEEYFLFRELVVGAFFDDACFEVFECFGVGFCVGEELFEESNGFGGVFVEPGEFDVDVVVGGEDGEGCTDFVKLLTEGGWREVGGAEVGEVVEGKVYGFAVVFAEVEDVVE